MANTNEKRTGPSEVEQGKNANEMFDATDDIPEVRNETKAEKTQDDLDRGEELYTGFGFGNKTYDTSNVTSTQPTTASTTSTTAAGNPSAKTNELDRSSVISIEQAHPTVDSTEVKLNEKVTGQSQTTGSTSEATSSVISNDLTPNLDLDGRSDVAMFQIPNQENEEFVNKRLTDAKRSGKATGQSQTTDTSSGSFTVPVPENASHREPAAQAEPPIAVAPAANTARIENEDGLTDPIIEDSTDDTNTSVNSTGQEHHTLESTEAKQNASYTAKEKSHTVDTSVNTTTQTTTDKSYQVIHTNDTTAPSQTHVITSTDTTTSYDPTDERKVDWDSPSVHTIRSTVTTTDATHRTPTSKETLDTIPVEKDTRIVIESQGGDVAYQTDHISGLSSAATHHAGIKTSPSHPYVNSTSEASSVISTGQAPHPVISTGAKRSGETQRTSTDQVHLYGRDSIHHPYHNEQTPDYELSDVYYTHTEAKAPLIHPTTHQALDHYEIIPIKKHYKAQHKQKKSLGIPWGKVAIGVVATLGAIGLVSHLTDDDDDGYFWQ